MHHALHLAAVLLVFATSANAARPHAMQNFGAIAYHRDSASYGYAVDRASAREAKREALRQCGEPRCEIVTDLKNDCGAVANGAQRFTTARGATRQEAEARALRKCGTACAVVVWACTR